MEQPLSLSQTTIQHPTPDIQHLAAHAKATQEVSMDLVNTFLAVWACYILIQVRTHTTDEQPGPHPAPGLAKVIGLEYPCISRCRQSLKHVIGEAAHIFIWGSERPLPF